MAQAPVTAAILAALSLEVQPFLRRVRARRLQAGEWPAWEFSTPPGKGVAVLSGMGEAQTARAAAWLLGYCRPQMLISLGFGGGVTPELFPGALVLGESFWRFDQDQGTLTALPAPECPWPLKETLHRFQAAGLPAFPGCLVTTPGIMQKGALGGLLASLPCPVLDLETGAAVVAAQREGIPFLALRAITDAAGEEIPDFLVQACRDDRPPTLKMALAWLTADPRRLPVLLRLWRRSRLAARNLARALAVVMEIL